MPIIVTLVALLAVTPSAAAVPSTSRVIAMPEGGIEAPGLDPALRGLLPGLMAAALESGSAYEVSMDASGAECMLKLSVAGKGPWSVSAQIQSLTEDKRPARIKTKKHPFAGREELSHAIDDLAAEIDRRIRSDRGVAGPPAADGAPIPLARALSPSTQAVDAYLTAESALRGGDPSRSRGLLDSALAEDPSFCLAAAERTYLDVTAASAAGSRSAPEKVRAGGSCRTKLAEEASRGLDSLARGETEGALQTAAALIEQSPDLRWGRVIHGLALAAGGRVRDSVDDWRAVTDAEPEDPRGQMWRGLSLLATGDYKGAAEALGRARAGWPQLLRAYTLQAEAQVRMRETGLARQTVTDMKTFMTSHGIVPDDDERNPDLMLGAVDLLEGHTVAALKKFETGLDTLQKAGAGPGVTDTLHNAIIEMKRDLIISNDPVTRRRQNEEALGAIDRYRASQTPEHRLSNPWELMKLKGLIIVREDDTVGAWKVVEEIKSHAGEQGYSEYYEAYLIAAILMKEGDDVASTAQFERAAKARDRIVDLVDLAQMQGNIRKYKESHDTYEEIARRLERYDPTPGTQPGALGELIVNDPHLAAMIPIYHYTWARLAYETNNPTESRLHFNRMLKYLQNPDDELMPLVKEAYGRGAHPE